MDNLARVFLIGVLFAGVLASSGFAEDKKVDNPLYKHWAQFKPGSYATMKLTSAALGRTTKTTITYTLKKITAEKAVVEERIVVTVGGREVERPPTLKEHYAKITAQQAEQQEPEGKTAEGEEEIEVAGRKFKAQWVEMEVTKDEVVVKTKVWTSEDVPGRKLKQVKTTSGGLRMTSEGEVVLFKADRK